MRDLTNKTPQNGTMLHHAQVDPDPRVSLVRPPSATSVPGLAYCFGKLSGGLGLLASLDHLDLIILNGLELYEPI